MVNEKRRPVLQVTTDLYFTEIYVHDLICTGVAAFWASERHRALQASRPAFALTAAGDTWWSVETTVKSLFTTYMQEKLSLIHI